MPDNINTRDLTVGSTTVVVLCTLSYLIGRKVGWNKACDVVKVVTELNKSNQ